MWYDNLRSKFIKQEIFNTKEEVLDAQSKETHVTRITKYKDFQDRHGIDHYKYTLHISSVIKT